MPLWACHDGRWLLKAATTAYAYASHSYYKSETTQHPDRHTGLSTHSHASLVLLWTWLGFGPSKLSVHACVLVMLLHAGERNSLYTSDKQ